MQELDPFILPQGYLLRDFVTDGELTHALVHFHSKKKKPHYRLLDIKSSGEIVEDFNLEEIISADNIESLSLTSKGLGVGVMHAVQKEGYHPFSVGVVYLNGKKVVGTTPFVEDPDANRGPRFVKAVTQNDVIYRIVGTKLVGFQGDSAKSTISLNVGEDQLASVQDICGDGENMYVLSKFINTYETDSEEPKETQEYHAVLKVNSNVSIEATGPRLFKREIGVQLEYHDHFHGIVHDGKRILLTGDKIVAIKDGEVRKVSSSRGYDLMRDKDLVYATTEAGILVIGEGRILDNLAQIKFSSAKMRPFPGGVMVEDYSTQTDEGFGRIRRFFI